jgi:predicted nucleic acid-binding protein
MHVQVYIDTNVFLRLLARQAHVTPEMSKFLALCQNGAVQLYLPQQTEGEFHANREDVIASTVAELRKATSIGAFPPIVESHEGGGEAARLRRELSAHILKVLDWYSGSADRGDLPFDTWFRNLREIGARIKSAEDLVAKATQRAAMHMPPGKGEDLGDRLIWECLLEAGEFCEDLHLITDDRHDYRCPLNPSSVRKKLQDEWNEVNWGKLFIHESIDAFLKATSSSTQFLSAAEIGRAVWTLRNNDEALAITTACETLKRFMAQLSLRQAHLIASAARIYYDAVFITEDSFDQMITEFYRHYGKHLTAEERKQVLQMLPAEEGALLSAANAN